VPTETYEVKNELFMLNAKSLKEFKEIWKKEKGEEISDDFAIEYSEKLLSLFNLI